MPFLFRGIRKPRWYKSPGAWLHEADISSDPLADLNTSPRQPANGNALSVWYIEDDRQSLDRIVAAMAAARDNLKEVDYVLFSPEIPRALGLEIHPHEVESLDPGINSWHRNIVNVSANRLVALAQRLLADGRIDRALPPKVKSLIVAAVQDGRISLGALKKFLRLEIYSVMRTRMRVIEGFGGVFLQVRDIERSVAFYRDALGLPLSRRTADTATVDVGDSYIGLQLVEDAPGTSTQDGVATPQVGEMITLRVPDTRLAVEQFRAAGLTAFGPTRTEAEGTYITVNDPDGHVLALMAHSRDDF